MYGIEPVLLDATTGAEIEGNGVEGMKKCTDCACCGVVQHFKHAWFSCLSSSVCSTSKLFAHFISLYFSFFNIFFVLRVFPM